MPFRTRNTYSIPGRGTVNTKRKTFAGKGPPPAGMRKVREPTAATAPTVTTSPTGSVSTSGFSSPAAASQAKRRQRSSRRRVRKVEAGLARQRAAAIAAQSSRRPPSQPAPRRLSPSELASKPPKFAGKPTAGTPTRAELRNAGKAGALATNAKGFVTTPKVRQASQQLARATKAARRSMPDLSGLAPNEAEVARLARQAHRKYPAIPTSVLMGDTQQESNFNAEADSGVAKGLTQFIPSTAASYGVKYGSGKPEKRSQVMGQAHYLSDLKKSSGSIAGALNDYFGEPGAAYAGEVLSKASAYRGLDKPGNPKVLKRLGKAKVQAEAVGLKPDVGKGVGPAPKVVVTRYKAGLTAMHEIGGKGVPYIWGGGHAGFDNPLSGEDCSGAISYVLHKMKVLSAPLSSSQMGSVLKPGPGVFTVFYNGEHTFARVLTPKGPVYWGTSVGDSGAGGLGPHPAPSAEYLARYNVGHVAGLGRKQALQLGLPGANELGQAGTVDGMTFGAGGATATIASGAGATKTKAGFSKSPIRLTTLQKYNRAKRKLRSIGVPIGGKKAPKDETHPVLQELIEKYGSANPVPTAAAERKTKALAAAAA